MWAAGLPQPLHLLPIFDSFCDDVYLHRSADGHDAVDDRRAAAILMHVPNEGLVDLQPGERQLLYRRQRGITGSEVVKSNVHSRLPQSA